MNPFWSKVKKTAGCWLWTKGRDKDGYGQATIGGVKVKPHRYAFELSSGARIGRCLEIDHTCRVRHCVRPSHLRAVTHAENVRAGGNSMKTKCKSGHPLSGKNLYVWRGERHCRACRKIAWKRWAE